MNRLSAILAAAVIVAVPVRAAAQSTEPPDESMLVGPVAFVPVLELRSLGYDSNVFNEDVNPRGDVSGSFVPSADYHLRMGRARLVGRTTVAFVYFQQFSGQRSIDVAQDVKFAVPMNRLTPYVSGTFLNTKQRPGLDIDLRARRIVIDLLAGLDLRLGGKTTLGASVSAAKESFAEQTIVEGVSLREQLTRRSETGVVQLSHALTPLTTISVAVEAERQTFSYDPSRDSTSFRIAPRVEFKPSALIHGSATVGYRSVTPSTPIVEPFSGLVAGVDLAYIFRGTTRIAVAGERDLVYSYRPAYPYYVLTAATLSLRQQLSGAWEMQATAGRQYLDYRQRLGFLPPAAIAAGSAVSTGYVYGGGLGYRLGPTTRIGADVSWSRRDAGTVGRDFEGWRSGLSMFYGF